MSCAVPNAHTRVAAALGAWFLLGSAARAHSGLPGAGDLWNGALHPFLDIKQAVALLALGLALGRAEGFSWRGRAEAPEARPAIFSYFLAAFASGALAAAVAFPPETAALAPAPLFAAGAILLAPPEFVRPRAVWIFGVAAFLSGLAFGAETPPAQERVVFLGGIFLAAVILSAYAAAFWERFERPWFGVAARIAGSWLIAVGAMLLGASLR